MNAFSIIGLVLFVITMTIFSPFFTIGAINLLAGTSIAWTLQNWLAAFWVNLILTAPRVTHNK